MHTTDHAIRGERQAAIVEDRRHSVARHAGLDGVLQVRHAQLGPAHEVQLRFQPTQQCPSLEEIRISVEQPCQALVAFRGKGVDGGLPAFAMAAPERACGFDHDVRIAPPNASVKERTAATATTSLADAFTEWRKLPKCMRSTAKQPHPFIDRHVTGGPLVDGTNEVAGAQTGLGRR